MLVEKSNFSDVLEHLNSKKCLSVDTETTGLRPWHGDRLFSIVIADEETEYYFDFNHYVDHEGNISATLPLHLLPAMKKFFANPNIIWVFHNAKYDLAMLLQEGIIVLGEIYCCRAQGRVTNNDLFQYNLNALLKPLGKAKDDAVMNYVEEHKLKENRPIPGKKTTEEVLHYEKVPLRIMMPYACMDARGTFDLRLWQLKEQDRKASQYPSGVKNIRDLAEQERKLTKVVHRIEVRGVKIDRAYCERAAAFEENRRVELGKRFEAITGRTYKESPKLFAEVFASDKERWIYNPPTKTGQVNPSFSGDVLQYFKSEAAQTVVAMRQAKSKCDFYHGFLYHADSNDIIHTNFNPDGAGTGRFSSSDPNLQNLSAECVQICKNEECQEEYETVTTVCKECNGTDFHFPQFLTRRAIIPRPDHIFIMPDYDQMEYKQMLDLAKQMMIAEFASRGIYTWGPDYFKVADMVANGYDVHQATADMAKITRKQAKTLNFALLYGAGVAKIALMLGVSIAEAAELKARYFAALPYIEHMIKQITYTSKYRGWVRNWAGRRYECTDPNFAYSKTNYVIQGGCADANKAAMIKIDDYLMDKKSKMVLTIHDEIPCEIHMSEIHFVPRAIKELMESVYPHKFVPLTAGMEWSDKSLGDKIKGYPGEKAA